MFFMCTYLGPQEPTEHLLACTQMITTTESIQLRAIMQNTNSITQQPSFSRDVVFDDVY